MTQFQVLTYAFFGSLALLSFSLLIWFLIRRQWRKIWLPTLRVLDLENSQVQKLKWQSPPWVPFLLFVLTGLFFLLFTTKPKVLMHQESAPTQIKVHLFLDMGPSVQASVSIPQYLDKVEKVWNQLQSNSKISVSTTHSGLVWSPNTYSELQEKVYDLGFHRGGVNIGSALKQQKEKIGDVQGILVFSDANTSGWQKFNWSFLSEEMKIYWVSLKNTHKDNVYFREVKLFSNAYDPTLEWDVEIQRSGTDLESRRGDINLIHGSQTLNTVTFAFKGEETKTLVRMRVSAKKLAQLSREGDASLLWNIVLHESDAMSIDNSFRTPLKGLRQDVLLVGETFGERQLEDPFFQLNMALQTFGFVSQRRDKWKTDFAKTPFVILAVDEQSPLEDSCPLSLANSLASARLQKREETFPILWLTPEVPNSSMKNLCMCFQKLVDEKSNASDLCEQAHNPIAFNEIMKASGVLPLGGKASNLESALGWFKEEKESELKVAVFSIPLAPSRLLNMDHGRFPLLIKELLQWQGLIDANLFAIQSLKEWPRVVDISQLPEWHDANLDETTLQTNVPIPASELIYLSEGEMPPLWNEVQQVLHDDSRFLKEDYEPGFWLEFLFYAMGILIALEFLWNMRKRLRSPIPFASLVFLILVFAHSSPVFAEISMSVLGSPYSKELDLILKEVPLRTSLEMEESVRNQDVEPKELTEPWYWIRDRRFLLDRKGALKKEFRNWIKRGGFLIVQGVDLDFAKIMREAFEEESPESSWRAIPPDHELMRSFYLIDALPSCNRKIWSGYVFDNRLAVLSIPFDFLSALEEKTDSLGACEEKLSSEFKIRIFINIIMAAMTTDYKRDQIHTREILKRLR